MKKIAVVVVAVLIVGSLIFMARGKKVNAPVEKPAQTNQDVQVEQPAQVNQPIQNNKSMELEIKTTQVGTGDRMVKNGDTISVLYTGKLTDGTVFDASAKHGNVPFDFTVGAGMVIKGWDQGFLGAKIGEKRTLTIPGDLAYGPSGIPGVIPPNATLVFDVELLAIK